MPITPITEYAGDVPIIGQPQPTFNQNVSDKLNYDKQLFGAGGEFNVAVSEINQTAIQVSNDMATAQSAADVAVSSGNFKGSWSVASGPYAIGDSFNHNGFDWRLNVNVSNVESSEPSEANQDWSKLPSSAQQDKNTDDISNIVSNLQLAEYDPDRVYSYGELARRTINGVPRVVQWHSNVESLSGKDPANPANRRAGWSDASKPFYWKFFTGKKPGETMAWDDDDLPEEMLVGIGQQISALTYHEIAAAKPHWVDSSNPNLLNIPDRQGRFTRGANGTTWIAGQTHEDAIRNIQAQIIPTRDIDITTGIPMAGASGAFSTIKSEATAKVANGVAAVRDVGIDFDASRVVPTAPENQPKGFIEWKGYAL
jgi:hypothetical protein